jgi:Ger(x)C family germination protein
LVPYERPIRDYRLVTVIGVDKGAGDEVALTLSAQKQDTAEAGGGQQSGDAGGGDKPFLVTAEADSLALALQQTQTRTRDYIFLGHAQHVVMGEAAARDGLEGYLDYFRRDPEGRYRACLYVVAGDTARALITQGGDNRDFVGDQLASLAANLTLLSVPQPRDLAQTAGALAGQGHLLLPLLTLTAPPDEDGGEEGASEPPPPQSVDIAGYAVIAGGRMVGTLEAALAPAVNLIQGAAGADGVLPVTEAGGASAALRVLKSDSRLRPRWAGDRLAGLTVAITLETALQESRSGGAWAAGRDTDPLAAQAADALEQQAEEVVRRIQALSADCLGLGDRLQKAHPLRFARLGDWDALFPELDIEVAVTVRVARVNN